MYGQKITADGDTREGSLDLHGTKVSIPNLETSANHYALDSLTGKDRQRGDAEGRPSDGGRSPKAKAHASPKPDPDELYEFATSEGLDEFDARQWFDMCNDRRWLDRGGRPIMNWKGALKRFCAAKARKRGKENGQ